MRKKRRATLRRMYSDKYETKQQKLFEDINSGNIKVDKFGNPVKEKGKFLDKFGNPIKNTE